MYTDQYSTARGGIINSINVTVLELYANWL